MKKEKEFDPNNPKDMADFEKYKAAAEKRANRNIKRMERRCARMGKGNGYVCNDYPIEQDGIIHCPKCNGTHMTYNKKGFSVGKALVGATLLGVWGTLAGNIGSDKIKATCLSCGKQFMIKEK